MLYLELAYTSEKNNLMIPLKEDSKNKKEINKQLHKLVAKLNSSYDLVNVARYMNCEDIYVTSNTLVSIRIVDETLTKTETATKKTLLEKTDSVLPKSTSKSKSIKQKGSNSNGK